MIGCWSTKGGSGTTVIAAALALSRASSGTSVRLVDACVGFESRSRLHLVRCPTLVIHAALDQVTSPRTTLPIERAIPGAIGETWDDLAHVVAGKEQKIRFANRLFEWLAST